MRIETDASAVIIKRIVDAYRAKVCTLAESGRFIALSCCKYNPISENQTQNTQTTAKKVTNTTALLRTTSMLFLNIAGAGFASQGDAERAMKMCPLHMGCTWQVLVPSFVHRFVHPVLVVTCCFFFSIFAPFRQIMS